MVRELMAPRLSDERVVFDAAAMSVHRTPNGGGPDHSGGGA
jgi:hypothetical protein